MSPEHLNAVLLERLKRLEALMVTHVDQMREKDALIDSLSGQITTLQVELKEWQEGIRVRGQRQRKRRRVRGAKSAKDAPGAQA